MKPKSFIAPIVMALSICLSASASLASSITCEILAVNIGGEGFGSSGGRHTVYLPEGGHINEYLSGGPGPLFTYTATSIGSFKLESSLGGGLIFDYYVPWYTGQSSIRFQESFGLAIKCDIFQGWQANTEKLFFDSASISGTLESNGSKDIQNAVAPPGFDGIWPYPPSGDWGFYAGGMGMNLTGYVDITVPITWYESELSGSRWGRASASVPFTGTFTLSGHVAVVPIPSALLLLGSGLGGLAIYGRRKIAS